MSFIRLTLDQPVIRLKDTATAELIALGARAVMDGADAAGRFALVEHPIIARPVRCTCTRERTSTPSSSRVAGGSSSASGSSTPSPVTSSTNPATCGTRSGTPPKLQPGCSKVISPSGFKHYFGELAELLARTGGQRDEGAFEALCAKYGLQMDLESVPKLVATHGLVSGPGQPE